MVNYYATQYGVSVMYVWFETAGVSFSFGF